MKQPYQKPPLTLEEQIQRLKERGLDIPDEEEAKEFLKKVQYSRLRPYWHPFEKDPQNHNFHPQTTFKDVVLLYELDRKLRLLVIEAVERFEVVLRSRWAYVLAHAGGPFAYTQGHFFHRKDWHKEDLEAIRKEWERAVEHDPIFRNYRNKYGQSDPPIWLIVECASFGTLSRFLGNIADSNLGKDISEPFELPFSFLQSATKHLVVVRNIAAHHSRLWDRELTAYTLPYIRKHPSELKEAMDATTAPQRIYRTLALLLYIMEKLHPEDGWKNRLLDLLKDFGEHLHTRMGFPRNYRNLKLWS